MIAFTALPFRDVFDCWANDSKEAFRTNEIHIIRRSDHTHFDIVIKESKLHQRRHRNPHSRRQRHISSIRRTRSVLMVLVENVLLSAVLASEWQN